MQKKITFYKKLATLSCMAFLLFASTAAVFAQNPRVDFKQAANQDPVPGDINWINSIVQQNNSHYYEGMAVPQRVILRDLGPGTHTIIISHQSIKNSSGTHAYDFLTSWDQAKQAAHDIFPISPLLNQLFASECGTNIPASFVAACGDKTFSSAVAIPAPSNPVPTFGTGTVAAKKSAFDAHFSAQDNLMIYAGDAISNASLTFTGYDGNDQDAYYELTWTSNASNAVIEFAGHLASGDDFFDSNIGWGLTKGSGEIAGAPFHIHMKKLDGESIGSQDNQVKDIGIRLCQVGAELAHTDVSCNGGNNGTITITTATGGYEPYQYSIDGINFQLSNVFTGLTAGTYTVTVNDANGCSYQTTVTISEPSLLTASAVATPTRVNCFGDKNASVDLTVGGGVAPYTFLWSNGSTTEDLTGVGAGTYSVTVTDANGCHAVAEVTITQPDLLQASLFSKVAIACKGESTGAFTITATGGTPDYSYSLDGVNFQPGSTFSHLPAGMYLVTVKDANGCTSTVKVTLEDGPVCFPYYTFSQGYYGNTGGKSCVRDSGLQSTSSIMLMSLMNGGPMVLGNPLVNKSFTVYPTLSDVNKLITIMPSGGPGIVLAKNYNLLSTANYPPLQNGKIRNVLLGQTITTWLNTHIPGNVLGSLDLIGADGKNYIVTIGINAKASCKEPFRANCATDANAVQSTLFPQDVINALKLRGKGTTVNDLLNFSSEALAGGNLYGTSLSSLTAALDAVITAFNSGRYFDKFSSTPVNCTTPPAAPLISAVSRSATAAPAEELVPETGKITVYAYPNPFKGQLNFRFVSPVSGHARMDIYDMYGQHLGTIFEGKVNAGIQNTAHYNKKTSGNGMVIYKLAVEDKVVTGKLQSSE